MLTDDFKQKMWKEVIPHANMIYERAINGRKYEENVKEAVMYIVERLKKVTDPNLSLIEIPTSTTIPDIPHIDEIDQDDMKILFNSAGYTIVYRPSGGVFISWGREVEEVNKE